jgi:2'-5' RNA ligase
VAKRRRQLSLFLPVSERAVVESTRRRLDPLQHSIVPAHVTLCRDSEVEPWHQLRNSLESLTDVDITLSFGSPTRLPDGCVLLPVVGSTSSYDHLRRMILGDHCKKHTPHITLLHPRNAHGRVDDLLALSTAAFPTRVQFTEISAIEQIDGGVWSVVQRFGVGF